MPQSRLESRMLCSEMVETEWRDESSRWHHATALLEDISPSGACLQFDTPVPRGVEMRLFCAGESLVGAVRYCVYREIGYFVGVEFDPDCTWSRNQFEPHHLLDLGKLVMKSARRAARRKR